LKQRLKQRLKHLRHHRFQASLTSRLYAQWHETIFLRNDLNWQSLR